MPVPEAAADLEVLHRDPHLFVVAKPPGIPTTTPGAGNCVVRIVRALDPDAPRSHPTSRLDAEVSGVVIFARTRAATEVLLKARRLGHYRRLYLGLASAIPDLPEGTWQSAIGIDPRDPRRRVSTEDEHGRAAETRYRVAATSFGAALLHLRPITGRTHQLRVHAAAAGASLLGDVHYGGRRKFVRSDGRVVLARRVMLHCAMVRIPTVGGSTLELRAPIPADLRSVWEGLGGAPACMEPPSIVLPRD